MKAIWFKESSTGDKTKDTIAPITDGNEGAHENPVHMSAGDNLRTPGMYRERNSSSSSERLRTMVW